jgi:thymidine kinase
MSLPSTASLDIIFGPMYANKTTEVIRRLIIYHDIGLKVLYINANIDTRSDKAFSTHNETIGSIPFDAIKCKNLSEQSVVQYNVVAVDEGQFFADLKDTVLNWVDNLGKIVIVAGLNGDFRRHPFGQINDLIPYADNVTKLTPFCSQCVKKGVMRAAHFTKRTVLEESEILIGGKEAYIPVCRQCYLGR